MTEEEKQALRDRVIESVQDYLDNYDWDKKFIEHFGEDTDNQKGSIAG